MKLITHCPSIYIKNLALVCAFTLLAACGGEPLNIPTGSEEPTPEEPTPEEPTPEEPTPEEPEDPNTGSTEELKLGEDYFATQCADCHGESGEGGLVGGPIDATKTIFSPSNDLTIELSLVDYIDQYMGGPTATFNAANCTIENGCAEPTAAYILNGYTADAGIENAVSEAVRLERVTKGEAFYRDPTVNCVVCHGDDGTKTVGNGKSLEECSVCGTWEGLRDYIVEFMPQEPESGSTETGPFVCGLDDGCANYTADWIWNTVNSWTLTTDGGERVETEDRYGQDTKRLKSYDMLVSDYTRVFGAVPESLEASATAFVSSPEYWHQESEIGAVALNVLANAALLACQTETLPAINQTSLEASCTSWAERMWLRDPTDAEVASCVAVATEDTITLTDEERAVFSCVSVMISLPALTY